jgi:hypothetical protein
MLRRTWVLERLNDSAERGEYESLHSRSTTEESKNLPLAVAGARVNNKA